MTAKRLAKLNELYKQAKKEGSLKAVHRLQMFVEELKDEIRPEEYRYHFLRAEKVLQPAIRNDAVWWMRQFQALYETGCVDEHTVKALFWAGHDMWILLGLMWPGLRGEIKISALTGEYGHAALASEVRPCELVERCASLVNPRRDEKGNELPLEVADVACAMAHLTYLHSLIDSRVKHSQS